MGLVEEKYNVLRKRLDQLGYRQTLDISTVPLVEKLFADLLHTTESFKASKQHTASLKEESQAIIQQGDPYKAENTRLLRENNDLHIQIIKVKEETDGKVKELKSALRKSEHECADLQFLNSQYAHKLKALQKQDQAKSTRIQQLHERNMNAVVETPGGRRRHIAQRRPVLEMNTSLPMSPGSDIQTPTKPQSDPYMCDLLRVADQQIAELNRQVKNMEEANAASTRKSETLVKQVTLRDKEIDRLQHLLEGGRPTKAMINDGMAESTERVISHLNIQVEYLQQANRELDAKLRASLAKQREEMEGNKAYQTKNTDLQQKYNKIQEELEKMKLEKNARLGTYETELDMIFHKIKDKENLFEEKAAQHVALQEKVEELKLEKKDLVKLLTESHVETERFTLVVKRLEEDKKEASRQIRDLGEENKQLKRNVNSLEHITSLKTTNLEQQKGMAEANWQDQIDKLTDERDSNKNQITVLLKEVDDVQKELNLKSEEVIYYRQECSNLQSLISKYAIPARENEPLSQLEKLSTERDKAKRQVSELQSEILNLKSNVRLVTSERDNIDALYLQATDEVKRLRSEQTDQLLAESGASLKIERDNAITKLKQALSAKEGLTEQLALDKQTAQLETEQLGDQVRDQDRKIHSLTVERDLLQNKASNAKETIKKLEELVTTSSTHLYTAQAGKSHTESQIMHLKTVAGAAQRSRDDLHNKLSEVNMELELVNQRNNFLDKQVQELQDALRGKNNTTIKMKQTLVDKEKEQDTLLQQLDEKTEKIHEINQKFMKQDNELHVLTMEIKAFEDKFSEQKQLAGQKDQEVASLRKQVNKMIEELSQLESVKELTLKHNKQLTDDVANMTSENQRLNNEMRGLEKQVQLLRKDSNEKSHELHSIEHLIGLKDADNQEIFEKYRELNMECDRIAREAKISAENCHSLQKDLAATADVKNALEARLKEQTLEIQKVLAHNENLENHIGDMESQVNEYGSLVKQHEDERKHILLDLETVREINNKIEGQREAHARQAANRSVEVEQLQRVIENLTSDCESLKRQVAAEKDCARNLEYIIKTGRQQEYDSQSKVGDKLMRINQLEAKVQIKETELHEVQEKYRVLCDDYERLKEQNKNLLRRITNEQFEREKAKNESNILQHQLKSLTPKPPSPSRQEALFEPKSGPSEPSRPQPDIQSDYKYRSEPVFYEHTLSPSVVRSRSRSARAKRYISSNDETDDSIMKEINRTMKNKTPSTVAPSNISIQASNISSIMTSLTETTMDQSTIDRSELERPTDSSLDSIAIKTKTSMTEERKSFTAPTTEPSDVSRQSSIVVEDDAAHSETTFDGDEDDSVYQAIRSSQRSSRQSQR